MPMVTVGECPPTVTSFFFTPPQGTITVVIRLGEIRQAPIALDKTRPIFVVVSNPFEDEFTVVFLDNDIVFSPERLTLLGSDQSSFKRPYNVRCDIRFLISEELIEQCLLVEEELVSPNSLKAITDRFCSTPRKNGLKQSCELYNQANRDFIFKVGGPVNAKH